MTAQNPCGFVVLMSFQNSPYQLAEYSPRHGLAPTGQRGRCPAVFASRALAQRAVRNSELYNLWDFTVRMANMIEEIP